MGLTFNVISENKTMKLHKMKMNLEIGRRVYDLVI
jgi:hypothetical protein